MADANGWSLGWTTNGTGDGVSGGYTQAKFTDWMEAIILQTTTTQGVLRNYGNELAVTSSGGSASPVSVDEGGAFVKGFFYRNAAAGTMGIPTPAAATRVDRIVLQADWGSQVVRFRRVAGTEGAGTPDLTQTDGTKWEIPLATVSITTGGVATVTDGRIWARYNTTVGSDQLASNAVTTVKIVDAQVTTAKIADANVTTAKIEDEAVTAAKIDNRTRYVFVPATGGENSADESRPPGTLGVYLPNGAGTAGDRTASGFFAVPSDYVSGFGAVGALYSSEVSTGSAYVPFSVSYLGAGGWTTGTYPATLKIDLDGVGGYATDSVALSGVAANIQLKFDLRRDSDNAGDTSTSGIYCHGFRFWYVADS